MATVPGFDQPSIIVQENDPKKGYYPALPPYKVLMSSASESGIETKRKGSAHFGGGGSSQFEQESAIERLFHLPQQPKRPQLIKQYNPLA